MHYFWTTFCIIVQFSFILDCVLHYFWTIFFIIFRVHFALAFRFHSFLTTFCIIFGPPFSFTTDYILHHFWTFCIVYQLHFGLYLGYILHWSTVFIQYWLHISLVLDQPFHLFPTTFCIIFFYYILHYIWTTFSLIFGLHLHYF